MNFFSTSLFVCSLLVISFEVARGVDCKFGLGGSDAANTITVNKNPDKGEFNTVQAAVDSIPENNDKWTRIHIKPGIYSEQVQIPLTKQCILLEGEDRSSTKITYNAHARTDTSATFTFGADNIVARRITFENSYNLRPTAVLERKSFLRGRAEKPLDLTETDLKKANIVQALAVLIYGNKCAFFDCGFVGVQDTISDFQGRHYFSNCYIEGAIDFIWGGGQSIYENCIINSTVGLWFGKEREPSITAQGRASETDPSGFVFQGGQVVGSGIANLGRAYGPFSRVIFYQTLLSAIVAPYGWDAWHYKGKEANLFYAEVDCKGAGSNTSKRVPWMKKVDVSQLSRFSKQVFINQDGWLDKLPIDKKSSSSRHDV